MANINTVRLIQSNQNKIMLYSADTKLTVSHIDFWLDTLLNTQQEFSILVRDEINFQRLVEKYPKLQICYAKNPVDVESVVNAQSNLKVILYTTNLPKNIHLIRFNNLKHIFIGTKNSEWLSQFNKSYRAYDEIWCGGEFVINRIKEEVENIGHIRFNIVGKPHLKEVLEQNDLEKISNDLLILIDSKSKDLLEKIYFTYHVNPNKKRLYLYLTNKNIKEDLSNILKQNGLSDKAKIFDSKDLLDDFAVKASCIIVDLKNLNPYLLSYNIPIIVYIEKESDKYLIEPRLLQEVLYCFSNKNELLEILKNLDKDNDFLKEIRENVSNQFFNKKAILEDKFIVSIKKCIN